MLIDSVERGASGTAKIAAGGFSFLLRLSYLAELGLDPAALAKGRELDETEAGLLSLAADATEAERQAVALLARAEQTRAGLFAKLEKKGRSRRAASLALDRLAGEGLLDDRRFAEAWLRSRLGRLASRAAEGPLRLSQGLRARGVDEETARAALASVLGPDERKLALAKAASRESAKLGSDREALGRRLRALGFKSGEIRSFFEEEGPGD
ncbi:MAG: RecX family transcriptional regulator [Spirochaetaceae bacterium]|nr:RecX family transcriptional regulator [Spirochaetaceae bacterium]